MKQTSLDAARDWIEFLFRPVLISAMVTCIAAAWVWALEAALAPWRASYLIWIVGVVTLEGLLVERQLRRRRMALLEPRTWQTRAAEIGMMLLIVKAASYINTGWQGLVRDVLQWVSDPESFFDFQFVVGLLVVGTLWALSVSIAGDLAEIEDENFLPGEPEAARARLQTDYMVGAIVILLAVGAQRLAISPGTLGLRPVQVNALAVLPIVYVGLGILLFGQVRLSLLLARWQRQEVPISSGIERRWAIWSLLFVAGISALVIFLPAGETSLGIYLLTVIAFLAAFLGQVIVFLLYLLVALLFLPFGFLRTQAPLPASPPQLPQFPPLAETSAAPDWLSAIRTVLLGVLAVLVVLFIVATYWRDRQASGIWKTIGDLLYGAWSALVAWLRGGTRRVQHIFSRTPSAPGPEPPRISLSWWRAWRAQTSRERVRRLYLALLERAARVGHARRPAQTPLEYSTDLQPHLHDTQGLSTLTDAFVQARYSRQDFSAAQVTRLHRLWQRLRDELRRLKM